MKNGVGGSIVIGFVHTDSTGRLTPLDGMILTGIDQLYPDGSCMLTLWEWQSGIPLPSITTGGPPPMNTTTTNATADTNATAATEEEGEQQQTNYSSSIAAGRIIITKIMGLAISGFLLA